jgi:hypothetical protein
MESRTRETDRTSRAAFIDLDIRRRPVVDIAMRGGERALRPLIKNWSAVRGLTLAIAGGVGVDVPERSTSRS